MVATVRGVAWAFIDRAGEIPQLHIEIDRQNTARYGVVMVSYFNQLCAAGGSPFQAVVEGAMVRLRTVLMTALLAMLGLLPMALSGGIGSEVQKPLAVVIIGGLVSATALTLIVLPTLYLLLADHPQSSDSPAHDEPIATVDTPSVGP
jgi:Cu/Ag efflux pump CusA